MKSKKPKIIILPSDSGGCGWYRCLLPAAIMQEKEKLDIEVSFNPTHEIMERGQIFIWQRQYKPTLLKLAKEYSHKKHIFELDDNLLNIAPDNPSYKAYQNKEIKENLYKFIQFCDHVTCSTEPLKEVLSRYNKNVTVLQNNILPEFMRLPVINNDTIRIGWQGSAHHYNDLKFITNALVEVCNKYPQVKIVWMGWLPDYIKNSIPSDRIEIHNWVDFEHYYAKLKTLNIDISLAPLEDNIFNKSKSALRYYENSLMGSCTIASNIYPYTNAIDHEKDGIIVKKNRHRDWYKAINRLVTDTDLRYKCAKNAQQKILAEHDFYKNIHQWIDVYTDVYNRPKKQVDYKSIIPKVDKTEIVVDKSKGITLTQYKPKLSDQEVVRKGKRIKSKSIKKILILKLDHIGDFILSLSTIKLIRTKFPTAEITLAVGKWNASIAKRISEVDKVLTFDFFDQDSEKGINTSHSQLLESGLLDSAYDLAVDLRRHVETRQILSIIKAKYRVGYLTRNPNIDNTLTVALAPPTEYDAPHISTQMYNLIGAIQSSNIKNDLVTPELKFTKEDIAKSNTKYKCLFDKRPIAISVSSGTTAKEWGDSNYIELIKSLVKEKLNIVLLGSKKDVERIQKICDIIDSDYVNNVAGELPIDELVLFLKQCSLYIGNDSGVGHIAGILNIPTFIIFHGIVSPQQWHPFGENTYIFKSSLSCQPCFDNKKSRCPKDDCLQLISPEIVQTAIIKFIKETK